MKLDITNRNEGRPANRRLAQWRVTWLIEHPTSHQLLWCIDSLVLRNPPLRKAAKRYRKPYWRPCNFKLTAFKQTFQDDFLTEFDTLFTDKSLLRIFIFCPHTKKMKFLLPPANGTFAFAPTHKLTLRKSKRAVLSNAPVTPIKFNSYICTAK